MAMRSQYFSVAGQQKSSQVIGKAAKRSKCPGLTLSTPDKVVPGLTLSTPDKITHGLNVNSGSPFVINFQFRSPLSGTFLTPQTPEFLNIFARPPGLLSPSYDLEPEESNSEDDSDPSDAQYISIPSTSPFYLPPPPPRPFSYAPASDPSSLTFASDALCGDESCYSEPAAIFHEELDRILPDSDEASFVLDRNCSQDINSDLLLSPTEVFTPSCFDSMKHTHFLLPSPSARYSPEVFPDVPVGCEEFEDEDNDEQDGSDTEASDSEECVEVRKPT